MIYLGAAIHQSWSVHKVSENNTWQTNFENWFLLSISISYQLTSEQAQGMVSKRDFVNLTTRRYIDETAILGAQACIYPQMPEREK